MKKALIIILALVILGGCGQTRQHAKSLSARQAKQALADYITAHPKVFTSPGRSESASEILKISVGPQITDTVSIGLFNVDLDKKTYHLIHFYGKPGEGWFENWLWDGSFVQNTDRKWQVNKPEFKKEWGK